MANVIELNDNNFDTQIKNADVPIIVDFFAPWCGHCRNQAPILEEFASELNSEAIVAKINVEENKGKAAEYFISGIPAILLFKNGELAEQKSGVQSKNDLRNLLNRHINA